MRDSSILTTELRPEEYGGSAPFLLKFKLPDYVFLGVPASHSLRMTAQGMKPFTSKQKPPPTPVSPPAPDVGSDRCCDSDGVDGEVVTYAFSCATAQGWLVE